MEAYTIYRASTDGAHTGLAKVGFTERSYRDEAVSQNVGYLYAVTANGQFQMESDQALPADITPVSPLPPEAEADPEL